MGSVAIRAVKLQRVYLLLSSFPTYCIKGYCKDDELTLGCVIQTFR